MGGVLRGSGRSHPLLSALLVCEVPLDTLYPRGDKGDRGGLSAVAGDVDLRGSGWIGVVSVLSSSYAIGLQIGQKIP